MRAATLTTIVLALAASACDRASDPGGQAPAARLTPAAYAAPGELPDIPWNWGALEPGSMMAEGFPESRALCRQVANAKPPASDIPDAKATAALKGCSSSDLYYGIDGPKDPAKARACAFAELTQESPAALSGASILMNIYANGDGAKRDLNFATRMACSIEIAAPFETDARVTRLQEMRRTGSTERFDFCDDITSGMAAGLCQSIESGRAGDARDRRIAAATQGWPAADLALLAALQKAEKVFAEAHADIAYSQSGTMRNADYMVAEDDVLDFTADLLDRLTRRAVPASPASAAVAADAELNRAYQVELKSDSFSGEYGGATTADLRKAQRAWIGYRDAWLALARKRWPDLTDAVALEVIKERIRQFTCTMDDPDESKRC